MTSLSRLLFQIALPCLAASPSFAALQDETAKTDAVQGESTESPAQAVVEEEAPETPPAPPKAKPRKRTQGMLPLSWSDTLHWRSIGPANMGGRITSMDVHPHNTSTYWIGTAGGGLLKTTNHGVTYEHQFTDQNTSSIGAVAVSPSHPDQVWVGTGENNPRNSVSWGDGVYKSFDGGASWHSMGLRDSFQISTIIIHPTNPDIVYVGALGRLWGPNNERGLYKTVDGGKNWERMLFVDELTGVIDIRMKPDDPLTLLVATYERERDLFCTNDPAKKWGPGSGVYRTTDGGATFTKITEGLPTVTLGRIGLDWYQGDSNVVFAVVESERITQERINAPFMGLRGEAGAEVGARLTQVTEEGPADEAGFKEDDLLIRFNGATVLSWDELVETLLDHKAGETVEVEVIRDNEPVTFEFTLGERPEEEDATDSLGYPKAGPYHGGLGGQRENIQAKQGEDGFEHGGVYRSNDAGLTWKRINSVNPRPMYYSEIRVDPSNSDHLYVLGTSLYRSKDGGKTFTSDGARGEVHVDHHAMWIDPDDGEHIMLGNDGGLYVTWDRMDNWDHHNHVAIGQFYNITCDTTADYKVYGGLQDNGSWGGPSRSPSGYGTLNTDWFRVGGGDGFVCRVDPEDPDLIYYESQNGGMGRQNLRTGRGGSNRPSAPKGSRNRFNWNTPFILSHINSRIFYCAGNRVFRSLDRGSKGRSISPEITHTDRGSATALAESPLNPDVLYVGTDDGALWTTRDGGREWIDLFALNGTPEAEVEEEEEEPSEDADKHIQQESEEAAPKARQVSWQAHPIQLESDQISGLWLCTLSDSKIKENKFQLTLVLDAEGQLSGSMEAPSGSAEITSAVWDEEGQSLTFLFKPRDVELHFNAKLDKGTLKGSFSNAAGSFSVSFKGSREGGTDTPAQPKAEPKADPTPTKETVVEKPADSKADPKTEPTADPEPKTETVPASEEVDEPDEVDEPEEKPEPKKFIKNTIDQLLPDRFYVSSITPSAHKRDWVYVTFDAHRSDDTRPYVFVSEDQGNSWESLRGNLPDTAGSVRDLEEDIENPDVLYLGTEHRAYVSVDRGESWTELGKNLPTVAVHDFVQHPTSGELIAGTHGRSVWILDVSPLRQMTKKTRESDAHLFKPNDVTVWRRGPSRGSSGTRRFEGENPNSEIVVFYSLGSRTKDVSLTVNDAAGKIVRELEASGDKGFHRVDWSMVAKSKDAPASTSRSRFRGRRRSRMGIGTYTATLTVGDTVLTETFEVHSDPNQPDNTWLEYEELLETLAQGDEEEGGDGR